MHIFAFSVIKKNDTYPSSWAGGKHPVCSGRLGRCTARSGPTPAHTHNHVASHGFPSCTKTAKHKAICLGGWVTDLGGGGDGEHKGGHGGAAEVQQATLQEEEGDEEEEERERVVSMENCEALQWGGGYGGVIGAAYFGYKKVSGAEERDGTGWSKHRIFYCFSFWASSKSFAASLPGSVRLFSFCHGTHACTHARNRLQKH